METHQHLIDIIRGFDTAMLVSHANDGSLRARPMAVAKLNDAGEIWFLTNRESAKTNEIHQSPTTLLTFQSSNQFVSVSGRSVLKDDRTLVHRLWTESWKVWFPGGKDDPSISLVHFIPEEAEYWDNAGIKGIGYLFKARVAYLKETTPKMGKSEHAKVEMEQT